MKLNLGEVLSNKEVETNSQVFAFCIVVKIEFKRNGTPIGIRTPNLLIRSQVLYPIEPWAHTHSKLILSFKCQVYFSKDIYLI